MTSARQPDPAAPLVIVNRRAARLANPARRAEIVDAVRHAVRARTAAEPAIVDGDQDAARSALDAAIAAPLIVAVGGDGTVRDVVSSRVGRTRPVAIVPGGTGNVLAASLGIRGIGPGARRDPPWRRPGDRRRRGALGSAGRRRTPTAAPTSWSPAGWASTRRVMAAAAHEWKRRLGFGAYVGAGVRELARLETADFHVTADGVTFRAPRPADPRRQPRRARPGPRRPEATHRPRRRPPGPHRRRRGGRGVGPPVGGAAAAEDRRDPRRHHPHPGPAGPRRGGSAATDPDRRRPPPGRLARGEIAPAALNVVVRAA